MKTIAGTYDIMIYRGGISDTTLLMRGRIVLDNRIGRLKSLNNIPMQQRRLLFFSEADRHRSRAADEHAWKIPISYCITTSQRES